MVSQHAQLYRALLRQLKKASLPPHKINPAISSSFRTLAEQAKQSQVVLEDLGNALTLIGAQREYKILLDRYNPLVDLTAEERIEKTAHRVGLNMPKTVQ
ncbi:hypothetical protein D9757_000083 [Collybiopsis confluens]|uniref:Uncharacterized protein n=1 Tax=Collybiopsis confluens TaxID=2823264 RepID=A0A8H5I6B2_9AGAR|nr:hypothetical protein D9757_000083 [Collybiopsis confluens]